MNTIQVKVEFWGPAREWVTVASRDMTFAGPNGFTVGFLRDRLIEKFPRLAAAAGTLRFAVGDGFVRDDEKLNDGDVVSVIPPVSGG